ncbi:MAG: 2-phosphosulfolactate phosphatase, partial [Proteobacteria bacterium]|nr:2-phosphosulfolactate phosphatase [Pseudomonadota bacterium]
MADEVEIESLGARGDGVAEGGALYVPYTLPGERVRVVRFGARGGGRARAEAVLTSSPERVEPLCPHFGACGGCSVQHASDRFIALWKRDLIAAALAARGIDHAAIRPTITSAPRSRRRITVAARRTRKGVLIGFHAPAATAIVAIRSCAVAEPALIAALPRLEELALLAASRKGEVRLTLTLTDGGIDVAITGAKAMAMCRSSRRVLIGAFVNFSAICNEIAAEDQIEILCAGTNGEVSREDALLAGAIADQQSRSGAILNDQAQIAADAWRSTETDMAGRDILASALERSL